MREYPRAVYKSREVSKRVYNEQEELQAGIEGWNSHWNPEINKKQRGTDEEILRHIPHEKVLEVAVEAVKEEMPKLKDDTEEMEDSPYVKFEAITGFKAICDRGPYKGQETKGFKEWMKNGSDR